MHKGSPFLVGALLLCSAAGSARAQNTNPASAKAAKPIAPLVWLIGGVWTADASKLGPGMQRIETRYSWSDNDSFIRFTTHFVTDKQVIKTYDGNFFWNPSDSMLSMWYMDASGAIIQCPVRVNANEILFAFEGQNFEGRQASLQVQVTRKTDDLYHWSLSEKQGDGWKQLAALDYARMPGSASWMPRGAPPPRNGFPSPTSPVATHSFDTDESIAGSGPDFVDRSDAKRRKARSSTEMWSDVSTERRSMTGTRLLLESKLPIELFARLQRN